MSKFRQANLELQIDADVGLVGDEANSRVRPFKQQLLKWIGNKQRFAHEIISFFPSTFGTYYEPFLGSAAVLATLSPERAIGSDTFKPLIDIFSMLSTNPEMVIDWYNERWSLIAKMGKVGAYEYVKQRYNANANPADFLFLTRSCYGGVVRFRKSDGYMSTPCGAHDPIDPQSFNSRVKEWSKRLTNSSFICADYKDVFSLAVAGDLIYCDPPYSHSQAILYGAQSFSLNDLFLSIKDAKDRGVYVVLSIDGSKGSGSNILHLNIPPHLFERELSVNIGRSMLKRFQMEGLTLEDEVVTDRLLLTY